MSSVVLIGTELHGLTQLAQSKSDSLAVGVVTVFLLTLFKRGICQQDTVLLHPPTLPPDFQFYRASEIEQFTIIGETPRAIASLSIQ